jgi:hypothetical protein
MEPDKCRGWLWTEWEKISEHQPLFGALQDFLNTGINPLEIR